MTFPSVIRIFFAIDLSPATKEIFRHFISGLKKKAKGRTIRWSKAENLHITLQFLAEVKSEDLPKLLENVRAELTQANPFLTFQFPRLHLFPNPYRPRVVVVDITPQEELAALAKLIGRGIVATGYAIEDRPFRAHLTLGRIKQTHKVDLGFLQALELPALDSLLGNEVTLFRSEPEMHGSKYTIIEKIQLLTSDRIQNGC